MGLLEFTGERVVPGLADQNLFNEHRARYRFAAWLAASLKRNAAILDAGCGTGYGIAEFAPDASIVAIDISADAVGYAREHFGQPHVRFAQASCDALPFADESFDLIAAFEVIEHLERWPDLLTEARRILKPAGILLVSTPNKIYYAETRAEAGPNPFHVLEFEYAEFAEAMGSVFPHIRLWNQNHVEAIAFVPEQRAAGFLDAPAAGKAEEAHFFLAAGSKSPLQRTEAFAYLPASGNLLREREQHIHLLQQELNQKTIWLSQIVEKHATLHQSHKDLLSELQQQNAWADRLNGQLRLAGTTIAELQLEAEHRLSWIADLEAQIARARVEIERLNKEIGDLHEGYKEALGGKEIELAEADRLLADSRARLTETREQLDESREALRQAEAVIAAAAASRWNRLGRALNVGPNLGTGLNHGGK